MTAQQQTILRWLSYVLLGVLSLLLVLVLALHIWLTRSPEVGAQVVMRAERLTGMHLIVSSVDARLGWYGPELVFKDARVVLPKQTQPVIRARAGRVGFDLWRAIRTARLASARVVLEGAATDVVLTEHGVELRGQGEWSDQADVAHVALNDLPVGHVRIEDSSFTVQDERQGAAPWKVTQVALELERDLGELRFKGRVHLASSPDSAVAVDARLNGDLNDWASMRWRAHVGFTRADLGPWASLWPTVSWLPTRAKGDLEVDADGAAAALNHLTVHANLHDVQLSQGPLIKTLAGQAVVVHKAQSWSVTAKDVTLQSAGHGWQRGAFALELGFSDHALVSGSLKSAAIDLSALSTLAPLMPQEQTREALVSLRPDGLLRTVDLIANKDRASGAWQVTGGALLTGVSVGALGKVPGVGRLDGQFVAAGDHGRLNVSAEQFVLDLQSALRAPVYGDHLKAMLTYRWVADGLHYAAHDVVIHTKDGSASGQASGWLPSNPEVSPRLDLDFNLKDLVAQAGTQYLPAKIIPAEPMRWLDAAFISGKVPEAHLQLSGELRRFPFRDGGGLFRVTLRFEDMHLHYHDGFQDVEEAAGTAEFKNQGFSAQAAHARIGGIQIRDAVAGIADFKEAEVTALAHASGDVRDALSYLKTSPVGPTLGEYFLKTTGQGPLTADVALDLPFKNFEARTIKVDGRLARVQARLPGIDADFRDVSGAFSINGLEITIPDMTATAFGGPLRLKLSTGPGANKTPGERVWSLRADGRATGDHLQPLLGVTHGQWLQGVMDWRLEARAPRLEWRPKAVPLPAASAQPLMQKLETRYLPINVHLESTLAGMALRFPAPLFKSADESRALRVDLVVDPELTLEQAKKATPFKRHDHAHPGHLSLRASLGRDAGAFEWRLGEAEQLEHGAIRFGGGTPELRSGPGLWVDGHLASYDLSAWLSVRTSDHPMHSLNDVLKGGTVTVDHFGFLGFQFPAVAMSISGREGAWYAAVDGPAAHGQIVVPWGAASEQPVRIDLERLALGERATAPVGMPPSDPIDPAELPAVTINIKNLEVQKRHFGALTARIRRVAHGIELTGAQLKAASFEGSAKGHWTQQDARQSTLLSFQLDSNHVQDTLTAWGFEPTLTAKSGRVTGQLHWDRGLEGSLLTRVTGEAKLSVDQGQLLTVKPGAGRVLGLFSLAALPRRLTLDFSDVTDKGFAFDSIKGDFEFREGNAYTTNLALKGPAAQIGIVGRTGLATRDYDQTAKVAGSLGTPLAAAGVLAGGPAVGAALLLFSSVFKEPLTGITRGYYRITGSWENPKVERISAGQSHDAPEAPTEAPTEAH